MAEQPAAAVCVGRRARRRISNAGSNGEPVRAHGRAWDYVAGRFLARHRLAHRQRARRRAVARGARDCAGRHVRASEHAKAQAEQRFNDVRALSRYVLFDVYDRLESVPRALTLRRDIADAGQQYLDRLSQDPDAPLPCGSK